MGPRSWKPFLKGELTIWADPLIEPGQTRDGELFANLSRAQVIILLISSDFVASSSCMDKELKRAVERRSAGEREIVPVVVRACRFDRLEIGEIQAIQPDGKPIKQHRDRDRAWVEVTRQLDRVIEHLRKGGGRD